MKTITKTPFWRLSLIAIALIIGTPLISGPAVSQADTGIKVISVDRQSFFTDSAAAKDVSAQVQTLRDALEKDLEKKAGDLKTEEEQLKSQQSILTQEVFEQKVKQFQEKIGALESGRQTDLRGLQAGLIKAQNEIWQAVSPILDEILKEKGATLMLERNAIVKGSVDIDVTAEVMKRLDEKLPKVKVEPAQLRASNEQ